MHITLRPISAIIAGSRSQPSRSESWSQGDQGSKTSFTEAYALDTVQQVLAASVKTESETESLCDTLVEDASEYLEGYSDSDNTSED